MRHDCEAHQSIKNHSQSEEHLGGVYLQAHSTHNKMDKLINNLINTTPNIKNTY